MYQTIKRYLEDVLAQRTPKLLAPIHRYKREIKYIISGGSSALAALVVVFVVTDVFKVWYLISVIFGQVVGFFTNFYLQKFWTFRDPSQERMHRQFKIFIGLAVAHMVLNVVFISILVEVFGMWYLLAQAIVLAVLAIGSYLFNRFITFRYVSEIYESINDKHRRDNS
ncbi:MAG: GtrA family protein [Patescibacteria group bacterium]|jgi:dolichol-phosphate mannosyltransferase|nr:GtrA family protein [Patescibacteria group bacterium]|tara:strand:- start:14278 stop:14781 length:504 start_codon:yes stop_codon:yes gene_type:complete